MGEKKWHYFSANKRVGPVSSETIQEMLDAGALDLNTQVWTQGFESWENITTVDQFHVHHPSNVPPPPETVKALSERIEVSEISGPQIRPWVRYWARMMDLFLFSLLLGIVLGIIYPPALEIHYILFTVIILFVYVFVEAIMLSSWGTTPGKALLRVTLRKSTGGKPTYLEALSRSFSVWFTGWGLGIPVVSLVTLYKAYKRLTKSGITTWDQGGNFKVSHGLIGATRIIVTVLCFIGFLFLTVLGELNP